MPTIEKMKAIIEKYKLLWTPTVFFKRDPVTKRRIFLMRCKCGTSRYVRWNKFSMGLSVGCRKCVAELKKLGAAGKIG